MPNELGVFAKVQKKRMKHRKQIIL